MPTRKPRKPRARKARKAKRPKLTAAARRLGWSKSKLRSGRDVSQQGAIDSKTGVYYSVWKNEIGAKRADPRKPWQGPNGMFRTQTEAKNEAGRLSTLARKKKRKKR